MTQGNFKVLMVDDDEVSLGLLKQGLSKTLEKTLKHFQNQFQGFEIEALTDSEKGMQRIKDEKYHLVFLDLLMPKVEGHQILFEIKKMGNVPVILSSGFVPGQMKEQMLNAGAFAILSKPINFGRLQQHVERVLKLYAEAETVPGSKHAAG